MNTNPATPGNHSKLLQYLRPRPIGIALATGCIVLLAAVAYAVWFAEAGDANRVATVPVQRGPLVISLTESGTVQNRERAVIKNEVEGVVTILYLIPEGVQVKKGELLVELDSSRLVSEKNQQQITVMNSEAAFIRASENQAVTKSQAASDISQAELTLRFAKQDLEKYSKGDYLRELEKAEADINIASEERKRADDKLVWSERLADEKYITDMECQADELAAKRAEINLKLANSALDLLKLYTHTRNLDQLESNVIQAKEALDRTQRKASADIVQANAELKARDSEYERQKDNLVKISDQIVKCRIESPAEGMVVYATTGQGSHWSNAEPLQEGQQLRERQEIIHIPTEAAMMAEVNVHESSLTKISQGMPVRITVDAVPGHVFWGRVGKIALLPDAMSARLNPDLKVYNTEIYLDGNAVELRPSMTCRAEIIVKQYPDALYVPVQSIMRVGPKTVAYVQTPNGVEQREVTVGLDNNRVICITKGLEEGESVLLAPPLAPSTITSQGGKQPNQVLAVPPMTTTPRETNLPAVAADEPASQPAFDPSKLRDMSPEERRKLFESLPPEQREELQRRRGGQGRSSGAPRPAGAER
ncbi:MAG: HlyD family efflux transporter periplasmic adaptor subunit [Planctomycetes bacterium]|nr:HlyD family efflux transporter periplasmic adaptor subunit [Planctomycetota bacterium]